MFVNKERIYDVNGLTIEEKLLAKAFIKGAVYAWLNCHNDEDVFAVRDLFGKDNTDWTNTPLECIWNKHKVMGKNNKKAHTQSAIDVGRLLKAVLNEDTERKFKKTDAGLVNGYIWIKS